MGESVNRTVKREQDGSSSHGTDPEFSRSFLYLMTFGVTLGSLCFGYNLVVISGAMLYVQPDFELDTTWQSVIVGAAMFSATVSSLTAGRLADQLGRRMTLLLTSAVCVAGPVLTAAAPSKEVLLVGRLVTGLTFPLTMAFSPLYIVEMSPANIRGRLVTFDQLQVNIGTLSSAVMAGVFSYLPSHHWRSMFGFAVLPGLCFGVAMFLLPETPRWLVARGRSQEASRVLQRIYGCDDVSQELKAIEESVSSDSPTGVCSTLSRVGRTPHVRKALAVGSCLGFFCVWSGVNAILFFSGTIMKMAGFPGEHAVWMQGTGPLAIFISSFPVIWAVERFGRRTLVLISIGGCALCLIVVSVGFHLTTTHVPHVHDFRGTNESLPSLLQGSVCFAHRDCDACIQDRACGLCYRGVSGFCLPARNEHGSSLGPCAMDNQKEETFTFALDYCPSPYVWIVMAGIFLYCLFYCPGLAALTFTINVEIYPMWARSICTSLVVGLCWLSNTIITFSFLTMVDVFTIHGTFWFFAAMCILGFILLAIFLPETKYHNL